MDLEEKFSQWMIDKGKAKQELTDVHINDNGSIRTEKKMAWTIYITPNDWKDFCKETGVDYEEVKLYWLYINESGK